MSVVIHNNSHVLSGSVTAVPVALHFMISDYAYRPNQIPKLPTDMYSYVAMECYTGTQLLGPGELH